MSHGWLWLPGIPAGLSNGGFLVSVFIGFPWLIIFVGAVVWDLGVCLGWLVRQTCRGVARLFGHHRPVRDAAPGHTAPKPGIY
jgi:hypothetical protein